MTRSVEEWRGRTDDTPAPPRVRLRVFERAHGRCHRCERTITPGESWTLEHLLALILGGENREKNLGVTCNWCLPQKNREDVAMKAKNASVRKKHTGAAEKRSQFPTSRNGPFKQKIGGQTVRRNEE